MEQISHREHTQFNFQEILHELKHYLPAQDPLKDFIHHNTLHAFQKEPFYKALAHASNLLGYKVLLSMEEYRKYYASGRIKKPFAERAIVQNKGASQTEYWLDRMLHAEYDCSITPRVGQLRAQWKKIYHIDLDSAVHPGLFRLLCSYLDQGISTWNFPVWHKGFLNSLKEIERKSYKSFFKTPRARDLLLDGYHNVEELLEILVGEEALYKHYLFDQQFAHQGWSGMVSAIEDHPHTLLDHKKISLQDLIYFELLLEIDRLDDQLGIDEWKPLAKIMKEKPLPLFDHLEASECHEVLTLWQEAFEWSYYDQVLKGIQVQTLSPLPTTPRKLQAMFCIDDRECSLRRYLENLDPGVETFGTPGFFGVEFYYKPDHAKFNTKLCPAPFAPKYLIKELGSHHKVQSDVYFNKLSHSMVRGWFISQALGFWSSIKLLTSLYKPTHQAAGASSFEQMDKMAQLTIENTSTDQREDGLQIGFTVTEMADRVEAQLRSIGLVKNFAPIIYVIGHGSSSVNNPHYAAYDCGACSGRPGSVNARVFCFMANHAGVRALLASRGLELPEETQFLGGIHDTSRDEILFFDESSLSATNQKQHEVNEKLFEVALDLNAKERSRRFESVDTRAGIKEIHEKVKARSVSLFEPRPELNHATNALCVIGRRDMTKHLFLDRRAFMNSYNYQIDPEGIYLFNIIKAAAPVCGGINLEYFFSRVDNQKLGAGTKLPHNVMGLFGVANGIDGDLRPGLPSQMIEVHEPVRLLMIIEHFPEVVLRVIQKSEATYEWFINEWVKLVVVHPDTHELSLFGKGIFEPYHTLTTQLDSVTDINILIENETENLPVYLLPH